MEDEDAVKKVRSVAQHVARNRAALLSSQEQLPSQSAPQETPSPQLAAVQSNVSEPLASASGGSIVFRSNAPRMHALPFAQVVVTLRTRKRKERRLCCQKTKISTNS